MERAKYIVESFLEVKADRGMIRPDGFRVTSSLIMSRTNYAEKREGGTGTETETEMGRRRKCFGARRGSEGREEREIRLEMAGRNA